MKLISTSGARFFAVSYGVIAALLFLMFISRASAQTIIGTGSTNFYWLGTNNAVFATVNNWTTNSASTNRATTYPGTTALNDIAIFNYPASNNVAKTVIVDAAITFGGIIVNNSNTTAFLGAASAGAFTLNGFTNAASGTLYGIAVNPGAGTVRLGMANVVATNLPITLGNSQTWLNNGSGILAISNTVTLAAKTLTLGGSGNIYFNGAISGMGAVSNNNTGTVYFNTNNSFTGGLTIQQGTVTLVGVGTIGNSASLTMGAGSTLDVSAVTNLNFNLSSNVLYVSGIATIKAGTNGTVNLGSRPVIMTLNDSVSPTNPVLSIPQGTLSISNNAFTINTLSSLPLTNGTYVLAQQTTGNINTNSANAYTLTGTALSAGATNTLSVSNNALLLTISNASTNAAPITGIAPNIYYWLGTNNAVFGSTAPYYWTTNSASTVRASSYPGTTPAQNNIAVFNYPASNNVATVVSVNAATPSFGGIIVNNTNTTKFIGTSAAAAFTFNGFTNDSTGMFYGIVVNNGAGAVTIGATNVAATAAIPITLGQSQTWLNNSVGNLIISNPVTLAANVLTLGGAGNLYFGDNISGTGGLVENVAGYVLNTTYLTASNSFTGGLTIQRGIVALTGSGTPGNGNIAIGAGGTLDISGVTGGYFTLNSSNRLTASGSGTGSSAAVIKAAANGGLNLNSRPVTLTYDGANPALYLSQGSLLLFTNAFTINTTNGLPLANGVYAIAQQASGTIGDAGPYAISGTAIPTGATTTIVASNNVLFLTINTNYVNGTYTNTIKSYPSGVPITSSTNSNYYFDGNTNIVLFRSAYWKTIDSPSNPSVAFGNPFSPPFNTAIFNISASNNMPVIVTNYVALSDGFAGLVNAGGLIFNNSNSVTLLSSDNSSANAASFNLYGFTNASSSSSYGNIYGLTYGIVINPGAGPVTMIDNHVGVAPNAGGQGHNALIELNTHNEVWVNNGNGPLNIYGWIEQGYSYSGTLSIGGSANVGLYGYIFEYPSISNTKLALTYNGSGILTLGGTNYYRGDTTIQGGVLALTNNGTLGSGGALIINAGATFDVSKVTGGVFSLGGSNQQPGG